MKNNKEFYKLTINNWLDIGEKLFGTNDKTKWKFICPACGVSILGKEWVDNNAIEMFAFSCIGRSIKNNDKGDFLKDKKQPCNYAGGGFFRLNPVTVINNSGEENQCFAFDHPDFEAMILKQSNKKRFSFAADVKGSCLLSTVAESLDQAILRIKKGEYRVEYNKSHLDQIYLDEAEKEEIISQDEFERENHELLKYN